MVQNHEIIYVGQVPGKEDVYGLLHKSERSERFNFCLNYDNLAGYLEGAFAMHPREIEIANGIPLNVRGDFSSDIELTRIDDVTLEKLMKDSGVRNVLEFPVRYC